MEIAEWGFFAVDGLPEGVVDAVGLRLEEILGGEYIQDCW